MRLRVRGPSGQSTLTLGDDATVAQLKTAIAETTGVQSFDIKYSYPPKALLLSSYEASALLAGLDVKLNGEQLIVSPKAGSEASVPAATTTTTTTTTITKASASSQTSQPPTAPLSLERKKNTAVETEPPEIAVPDYGGTMVLRVMDDDNSCLFRAIGTCVFPGEDMSTELRSLVAQHIQANKADYNKAILELEPDEYCRWITNEDQWGGAIELDILSRHFGVEIDSIDVQNLRIDRFNEGADTRCIVVYSGIHYDAIAISPSDPPYTHAYAPAEFDTKVFSAVDPVVLEKALELCRVLKERKYFTDTANFGVKCKVCGSTFRGQTEAAKHASTTGHADFGQVD